MRELTRVKKKSKDLNVVTPREDVVSIRSSMLGRKEDYEFGNRSARVVIEENIQNNSRRLRDESNQFSTEDIQKTQHMVKVEGTMATDSTQERLVREILRFSKLANLSGPELITAGEGTTPLAMLGVMIGAARRGLGLEIEDLVDKTRINYDTLIAIELGAAPLKVVSENLRSLEDALGVDYELLSRYLAVSIFGN